MKSLLLVTFLILELGFGEPSICLADHHLTQLKISDYSVKSNDVFTFKITNHAAKTNIIRNNKGTFFEGDFSTLQLRGYNQKHIYQGKSFSFKYPPQHKIADLSQQIIQLQLIYNLMQHQDTNWKHKRLALSVSFIVTDYAPDAGFTLKQQIKPSLKNGTIVSLQKMLPLISGLNMILYKGIHSQFPDDRSFLWLVRRQLLLMSESEFQSLKDFIFGHISKENVAYHGLTQRLSDLNQIKQTEEIAPLVIENKQQTQNL